MADPNIAYLQKTERARLSQPISAAMVDPQARWPEARPRARWYQRCRGAAGCRSHGSCPPEHEAHFTSAAALARNLVHGNGDTGTGGSTANDRQINPSTEGED